MRIHEIKCHSAFFEDTIAGKKTFTVRKNDRNYEVGDLLAVNEINAVPVVPDESDISYTGRCCLLKVTYVMDNSEYCKDGFAILGFRPCAIQSADSTAHLFERGYATTFEVPCYTEV